MVYFMSWWGTFGMIQSDLHLVGMRLTHPKFKFLTMIDKPPVTFHELNSNVQRGWVKWG